MAQGSRGGCRLPGAEHTYVQQALEVPHCTHTVLPCLHMGTYYQVVPEISMHESDLVSLGEVQREPFDEPLHGWDGVRFRGSVLLGPGLNLPLNVVPWCGGNTGFEHNYAKWEAARNSYRPAGNPPRASKAGPPPAK